MIRLAREGGLWIATLDRPEKANALTEAMLRELAEIAEGAHEARALILTGTGKVFSAGADLEAARAGLAVEESRYLCVRLRNERRKLTMDRVYVHAVLRKPAGAGKPPQTAVQSPLDDASPQSTAAPSTPPKKKPLR